MTMAWPRLLSASNHYCTCVMKNHSNRLQFSYKNIPNLTHFLSLFESKERVKKTYEIDFFSRLLMCVYFCASMIDLYPKKRDKYCTDSSPLVWYQLLSDFSLSLTSLVSLLFVYPSLLRYYCQERRTGTEGREVKQSLHEMTFEWRKVSLSLISTSAKQQQKLVPRKWLDFHSWEETGVGQRCVCLRRRNHFDLKEARQQENSWRNKRSENRDEETPEDEEEASTTKYEIEMRYSVSRTKRRVLIHSVCHKNKEEQLQEMMKELSLILSSSDASSLECLLLSSSPLLWSHASVMTAVNLQREVNQSQISSKTLALIFRIIQSLTHLEVV